jgi:hypothetical protein
LEKVFGSLNFWIFSATLDCAISLGKISCLILEIALFNLEGDQIEFFCIKINHSIVKPSVRI